MAHDEIHESSSSSAAAAAGGACDQFGPSCRAGNATTRPAPDAAASLALASFAAASSVAFSSAALRVAVATDTYSPTRASCSLSSSQRPRHPHLKSYLPRQRLGRLSRVF